MASIGSLGPMENLGLFNFEMNFSIRDATYASAQEARSCHRAGDRKTINRGIEHENGIDTTATSTSTSIIKK